MMERVTLHVSGNIQRAIYGRRVMSIATTIGITGAIMNLSDGRIKIIAEGEKSELEQFYWSIYLEDPPFNVVNIEKEYSAPTRGYDEFCKLVKAGEPDDTLDHLVDLIKELLQVTKDGFEMVTKPCTRNRSSQK